MNRDLKFVARPRSSWEAQDLGIRFFQRWWFKMVLSWFVVTAPLYALLIFAIGPVWGVFVFWWLKPLFERIPLHILSQEVSGQSVTVRSTLKALPKYGFIHIFHWLTWLRLSPVRSLAMPLSQLERLSIKRRGGRLSLLADRSGASWLTIVFVHIESGLIFGLLSMLVLLFPEQEFETWIELLDNSYVSSIATYIAIGFICPLYVSCGFALYLNRRTLLEAWDIEQVFRKLVSRIAPCLFLFALVLVPSVLPSGAFAEADEQWVLDPIDELFDLEDGFDITVIPSGSTVDDQITEILTGPEFNQIVERKVPKFDWGDDEDKSNESPDYDMEWLGTVAQIIEFIFWLVGIFIVGFIVWVLYKSGLIGVPDLSAQKQASTQYRFRGLDIHKESLPDDIPAEVLKLLNSGDDRGAISLLYRACVAYLILDYQIKIKESDTEYECLNQVKLLKDAQLYGLVNQITQIWLALAYAHREPSRLAVESVLSQWPQSFNKPEVE